jgi:hypothetical protein
MNQYPAYSDAAKSLIIKHAMIPNRSYASVLHMKDKLQLRHEFYGDGTTAVRLIS